MKRKKHKPRKQAAGRPMLQIKTTIDFGEDGIPLERLGEITKLLKERHLGTMSKVKPGFVPIPFDQYLDLHVQNNPSVDRAEFAHRLRQAVDARKAGARCDCGAFIWAIGRPRPAPHVLRVLPARRGRIATTRSTKRWAFRPLSRRTEGRAGGMALCVLWLSKTHVACAKSLECAAVCCHHVRIDRFGGGDEPRVVLA